MSKEKRKEQVLGMRDRIAQLDISESEFCRSADIFRTQFSLYMTGKFIPSPRVLIRLEKALSAMEKEAAK